MKSILFYIARYPGYGGIENITTLLANHFISTNNKVSILSCYYQEKDILLKNLNNNVSFYNLPNQNEIYSEENQLFLDQIITTNNIDTIIYQDSYFPNEKLLLNVKKHKSLRIICVEHSAPDCGIKNLRHAIKTIPKYNLYKLLKILFFHNINLIKSRKRKQQLYSICDKYIVLSSGYIPIFIRLNKIVNDCKIKAIGNPISIPILDKLPNKENICLFVGRFSSEKGLKSLLKIWRDVEKDEKYNNWKLIMIGDGDKRAEVENLIKIFNIKRIKLEGFQTNIIPYYKKASILCMTSIFEGFPLTLPEAMGNGVVPIVFNTFAAVSDIIDNMENGIIVDKYDEKIYSEKLKELMMNSIRRNQLAKAAIFKAHKFSRDEIFTQWDQLI